MALNDTGWTGIVTGSDTGDIVETKLTTAFTNIDTAIAQVNTNTNDISAPKTGYTAITGLA